MPHSVGAKITELREKRHLTQAQLAEQLHFTHQTISNWERGVSSPDLETVVKLADFFQVSADELLFGKPKASSPAPQKLYRYMTSVPVGAANALNLLLRVFAGFAAAEIVLSFLLLIFPAFAVLIGLIPVFIVTAGLAGLYIAILVLFFFAKELGGSLAAKACFFIGIAVYVAALIATALHTSQQPDTGTSEDAAKFLILYSFFMFAGLATAYYSAPFIFQENEHEYAARKSYFVIVTCMLLCTAFSALFSSVEEITTILDGIALLLTVFGLFALSSCTENKTTLVCRTSTRPPQSAWLKDIDDAENKVPPVVNKQAASVAAAERARANAYLAPREKTAAERPASYQKTVVFEEDCYPKKYLWIAFGVYAFFLYLFPLIGAPFHSDSAVILLTVMICLPYLVLTALFALSKECVFPLFSYVLVVLSLLSAASAVLCFCAQIFFPHEPTALFPYALLAVPVVLNFCHVFCASLCFRSTAKNKAANVALSLTAAALSVGILVLFLISANDPNADPALLLLDFWANGAVFAFLLFSKKQKIKILTETVTRKRI